MRDRDGQHALLEAVVVRVHHVERHLHRVEVEVVLVRNLEHVLVDRRALVAGEADVAHLALLAGAQRGLHRAAGCEHPLRVVHADDLVELHQVQVVGLQAGQRLLQLRVERGGGAAVELGHQEHAVAVAAGQRPAEALLALAAVVVPAIVEEGDPGADRGMHDLDRLVRRGAAGLGQVETAAADQRQHLAGGAERAVLHVRVLRQLGRDRADRLHGAALQRLDLRLRRARHHRRSGAKAGHLDELTPFHRLSPLLGRGCAAPRRRPRSRCRC